MNKNSIVTLSKKTFSWLAVAAVLLMVGFLGVWQLQPPKQVLAQTESPTPSEVTPSPDQTGLPQMSADGPEYSVFEKERLDPQIIDLTNTYRGQLAEYRELERQYLISRRQYEQLKTLVSLEQGVKDTRKVMASRAQVLITYISLLRLQLIDANGVPVEEKQASLSRLDELLVDLAAHQSQVSNIQDKNDIVVVADSFTDLNIAIEFQSYKVMALLSLGKLQVVFDKADELSVEMQGELATQAASLKQTERERAIAETERVSESVRGQLQAVAFSFAEKDAKKGRAIFSTTTRELSSIYSDLSNLISYLYELTRI